MNNDEMKKIFKDSKKCAIENIGYLDPLFKYNEINNDYDFIKLYVKEDYDLETDLTYENIVLKYVFENYSVKNMRQDKYDYGLYSYFEIIVEKKQ